MKKDFLACLTLALALTASLSHVVQAASMEVEIGTPDDGLVQYSFSLLNDDMSDGIGWFAVFFDFDAFAEIVSASTPDGWDEPVIFQPDSDIVDDGVVDHYLWDEPLALDGTLNFDVVVRLLEGVAPPTGLPFEIYDWLRFDEINVIAEGVTQLREPPTVVPEPGSLGLLLTGIAALALASKRARSLTA